MIYDCLIIGGGASGMMCAVTASNRGLNTCIIDHNEKLGKKLYITGKGKCNLTNNSSIDNHLNNIVTNSKFMYSALNAFSPFDTMEFFENNGLKLRTERGKRVFPDSDKSSDVIKTLTNVLTKNKVKVDLNKTIKSISECDGLFNVLCSDGYTYTTNSLVIATGGLSYSGTGATDFGYTIAKQFGHKIVAPKPALCPIVVKDDISTLNGLSLRNIELNCEIKGKKFSEFGDLLFTYNSFTGPTALTLSSKINKLELKNAKLYIDLKPALSLEQLKAKLIREIKEFAKKDLKNYLYSILPSSFVEFFMDKIKLQNKKMADINAVERDIIINHLKKFDFILKNLDNINVGIVTSGGVHVKEIDSKTCMSKLKRNLYFVGEVLDIDALTGGFNLQIAWSTGHLAGLSISKN